MTNATRQDLSVKRAWPKTHTERVAEWDRRENAALGLGYTQAEQDYLGLFVATDNSGDVTHRTRRVIRDGAFVADTLAATLAAGVSLDVTDDALDAAMGEQDDPGDDEARARLAAARRDVARELVKPGAEVWKRSGVAEHIGSWAWKLAHIGDIGWEIADADEDGALFVAHKAQHVECYFDRTGRKLEAVRICFTYTDAPDDERNVAEHTYERWLRADNIKTRIDGGDWVTRPNPTGVVPFVRVSCFDVGDPCIGQHAAARVEDAEAVANSAVTQLQVVGTRLANPWLLTTGAQIASGEDVSIVGKMIGLPKEATAEWLEPTLQGLSALVENAAALRGHIKEAAPAFLFADASANASGTALSYRAGAYKAQAEPVQARFHRGIAEATAIARAMEDGVKYDPAVHDVFVVRGAPALPEDRRALAELLVLLEDADKLKAVDVVRALQGAGMVPADRSADEYLVELRAESDEKRERGVSAIADAEGRIASATRGPVRDDEPDDEGEAGEDDEAA